MVVARGVIQNRDRKQQIVDFSGLQFERGITPTDCDGFFELNDRVYVFFEIKYGDAAMPDGQRIALERLCSIVGGSCDGKGLLRNALLIQAYHEVHDPREDVDAAECIVSRFYYGGRWIEDAGNRSIREVIDAFREFIGE